MTLRIARSAALLAAAVLVLAACDPGFSYWIRNDSARDVVVRFEGSFYAVPAGSAGLAHSSLGVYEDSIEIADAGCMTTAVLEATTQQGLVVIDAAGARLEDESGADASAVDALSREVFEMTDACIGRVQPAASGTSEGSTILFIGGPDYDLHRIGVDGTGLEVLQATPDGEQNLSTSSDASGVVVDVLSTSGIGVARLTDSGLEPVDSMAWGSAISPDGASIALLRGEEVYEHGVLVVRDASGAEVELAEDAAAVTWSPDGRWLAYEVTAETEFYQHDLWVVRSDGSGARRLTAPDQHGYGVVWAPDSRRLAFSVQQDAGEAALSTAPPIYVFDLADVAGGGGTKLGDTPSGGWTAADWSPDGSTLLVVVAHEDPVVGTFHISTIDVATGETRPLTAPDEVDSDVYARWSADGASVLFLRGGVGGPEFLDLWAMDADGEHGHLVVTGVTEADWGPPSPP